MHSVNKCSLVGWIWRCHFAVDMFSLFSGRSNVRTSLCSYHVFNPMEQQLFSTLDWAQTPDSRPTCLHLLWLCFGLCVSLWQPAVSLYAGTSHSFHATIPISHDWSVDVAGARRCKLLYRLNTFSCIIVKFWGDMGEGSNTSRIWPGWKRSLVWPIYMNR